MTLRSLSLKPSYDSTEDDLLRDFYIPVLSASLKYSRITGFFSSTALAAAARGISNFVHNGGLMKIIAGARLTEQDVQEILRGKTIADVISESVLHDIDSLENQLIKDHVKALGWMVRNNKVQIRVAVPVDSSGNVIDEQTVTRRGIFHQKVGILEDSEGNIVSFSGSVNETAMAWLHNVEEFKLFRNWVEGETNHLNADLRKFDKFWNGLAKNMVVLDVPTAIRDKLISIAPKDFNEISHSLNYTKDKIKLREYQEKAVLEWMKDGRGIIEMATGTGKTFVAIACMSKIYEKEGKLAVVITCPFIHLVDQWQQNLELWGYTGVSAYGNYSIWKNDLANKIYDLNNDYRKLLIVVTTHDTFSSRNFLDIISKTSSPLLLIADEVHGIGSPERRKGLLERYKHRIGLSATPSRWFDDEGTAVLVNYFGGTIFEFGLKEAIPMYLTPYQYILYITELSAEEFDQYMKLTKQIAKRYFRVKNKENEERGLKLLLIKRQRIIVNARSKKEQFVNIIDSLNRFSHCLVYCSPDQIDRVQDILNSKGILQHKFTAKEDAKERIQILGSFENGTYQALVAMKCLDEGIDVPGTKTAIILASSTNPREFIQRRGRILRKHPSKEKSVIYDILVIPSFKPNFDEVIFNIERRILRKELTRVLEFASSSVNYVETLNKIFPIIESYKIRMRDLID